MNVHFGVVKKYLPQKGFGFVTHPLDSITRKDVFFHISNVQKSHKGIADKLSSYELGDDMFFWYETENTSKGEQLKSILQADSISKLLKSDMLSITQKLEHIWQNIETSQPIWLHDVTLDLIGIDGLNKLNLEREDLNKKKEEKKEAEELQRKEKERLQKIEREKIEEERQRIMEERQKQMKLKECQRKNEEEEFELLVAEMESKGFTMSAEVSNYIIRNRLGDKYKHISGVLEMENSVSSWKFNGGFPPKIYAMLCERLNLGNKGTQSRVVGFTAFKDL